MKISRALRLLERQHDLHVVSFVGAGGKSTALFQLAQELSDLNLRVVTAATTRLAASQINRSPAVLYVPGRRAPIPDIARQLDIHGQCLLLGRADAPRNQPDKAAGVLPMAIDHLREHAVALGISAILVEADGSRMLPVKAPADHEPLLPRCTTTLVLVLGLDGLGAPLTADRVHRPDRIGQLLSLPESVTAQRLTPQFAARLLTHKLGGAKDQPRHALLAPLLNKADSAGRLAVGRLIARRLNRRGYPVMIGAVGRPELGHIRERWSPFAVVILAAGGSTRMGEAKQLISVDGATMLQRAVQSALASDADQVLVVTGAHRDAVEKALHSLARIGGPRLSWVHNEEWRRGQSVSMRVGIDRLGHDVGAAILMPVDQPKLSAEILRRLVRLWQQGADIVAACVDGRIRGAPALFDRHYWPELKQVRGDIGGRELLNRYADRLASIAVTPDTVQDIDSPDDLAGLTLS